MSYEHCVLGHVHTGSPTGIESQIGDRKAYVVGDNKTNALIYLTDVWGYEYNNHRLLADTFAKELPATVYIPDMLEETGFVHLSPEELKNVDFPKFAQHNNKEKRFPQILALAEHLKSQYQRIFVIGYCWGAWGAVMLAAKPGLISGVSINHPSRMEMPGDLERLTAPTLIVAPYTDSAFPQKDRLVAEEIFDKKAKEEQLFMKITVYPGFVHGFAARGNAEDAFTRDAVEDAKNESVLFFRKIVQRMRASCSFERL
jgi:dienelactone hydrolase